MSPASRARSAGGWAARRAATARGSSPPDRARYGRAQAPVGVHMPNGKSRNDGGMQPDRSRFGPPVQKLTEVDMQHRPGPAGGIWHAPVALLHTLPAGPTVPFKNRTQPCASTLGPCAHEVPRLQHSDVGGGGGATTAPIAELHWSTAPDAAA